MYPRKSLSRNIGEYLKFVKTFFFVKSGCNKKCHRIQSHNRIAVKNRSVSWAR